MFHHHEAYVAMLAKNVCAAVAIVIRGRWRLPTERAIQQSEIRL